MQALDAELLARRETELLEKEGSGCRVLLMNDMTDDLSRMFRLFSRITDGLVPVAEIFKTHITEMGNEKIEQRLARYLFCFNHIINMSCVWHYGVDVQIAVGSHQTITNLHTVVGLPLITQFTVMTQIAEWRRTTRARRAQIKAETKRATMTLSSSRTCWPCTTSTFSWYVLCNKATCVFFPV